MGACEGCGERVIRASFAVRDHGAELAPLCLDCALDSLVAAHHQRRPLVAEMPRIGPASCERWESLTEYDEQKRDPRAAPPPRWVADPDLWRDMAAEMAPRWDELPHPWFVLCDVYAALGGRFEVRR